MLLKLMFISGLASLVYLIGNNTGFNNGYNIATKLEQDSCQKQLEGSKK